MQRNVGLHALDDEAAERVAHALDGLRAGDTVTPFYDSLLAKIISWGKTREDATARLRKALESFVVEGVKTNIPLHQKALASEAFARGELDTHFLERI